MNTLNLKINTGISTIILSSLVLAACGRGSAVSYSPNSGTDPVITTTVNISALPTLIKYGSTATITWSSSDSTSCTSSPSLVSGTSGTLLTPGLTTTTTYKVTCTGPTGSASKSVTVSVDGSSTVANIAAAAQCLLPPLAGSGVPSTHYYCDCGTGAHADCRPGNDDANPGTIASPKQTIGSAVALLGLNANNVTVALCKGGAFDPIGSIHIGSNSCPPNSVCNELRDYTPPTLPNVAPQTAKPIINDGAWEGNLINVVGNKGGVRILNLKLLGRDLPAGPGLTADFTTGVFLYASAHDVTMCNLDIDAFGIGVNEESNAGITKNIKLTGSNITRNSNQGFLGAGTNTQVNYNTWVGNGSQGSRNHAVYFASNDALSTNVEFIGNHVSGQYGTECKGVVVVAHTKVDGFRVENNTIEILPSATTEGCWGIGLNAGGGTLPGRYLRNASISNNIIMNTGNLGLAVADCPDCEIENNLIIMDWPGADVGIGISADSGDVGNEVSDRNKVRNNTVWFGPKAINGGHGIAFAKLGTGHTVTNNAVYYSAAGGFFSCFRYPSAGASYAFTNNNYCASAVPSTWVAVSNPNSQLAPEKYSLTQWRGFSAPSGVGFDTASITNTNPVATQVFTAPGTNFKPAAGSPLIGTGSALNGSVRDIVNSLRSNPPAIGAYEP